MSDIESLIDALLGDPVPKRQRTVLVHCDDGRREETVEATGFRIDPDGTLVLLDADDQPLATFAASEWYGAVPDPHHPVARELRPASWLRICLRRGPVAYGKLATDARAGGFDGRQLAAAARLLGVEFLQAPDGPRWYLRPDHRQAAECLVRELLRGGWRELGEQNRRRIARDCIALLLGQSE